MLYLRVQLEQKNKQHNDGVSKRKEKGRRFNY